MTTLTDKKLKCCVCGKKSVHTIVRSTNAFGSNDLDTRPPEMMRSTLGITIQRCPNCFYCSFDLSTCDSSTKKLVKSSEYQEIVQDQTVPTVAASFLAFSYEKQQTHQFKDSAWGAIYAAWICDSRGDTDSAKKCRLRAISIIEKGEAWSHQIADQPGASEAIMIDLLRRAGMFEKALKLAKESKEMVIDDVIKQIIRYQETLIGSEDVEVHTMSEALDAD